MTDHDQQQDAQAAGGETPPDVVKRARGESGAVAKKEDLQPTWTDKDGVVHRKRILTGDRTTGKLHLGHYVGSLRNRVELQHHYDTYILMADIQALTTHWENPKILRQSVMDVALDYLAIGLEPYTGGEDDGTKVKIVIQSAVPAIAELTVLYGLVTPMSLIEQNPTTKAEAEQYGYTTAADTNEVETVFSKQFKEKGEKLSQALLNDHPELQSINLNELKQALKELRADKSVAVKSLERDTAADWGETAIEDDAVFSSFIWQDVGLRREARDAIIGMRRKRGRKSMSFGFLGYPVSQAADITFVNAHLVPVGDDQVPHIELTREIVRRMNRQYGGRRRILVEPQALVGGATLKALDGSAKMSKSLGNAVYLSDSDADIWKQLKVAVTDPQRVRREDPGRPEVCNVFSYHQQFCGATEPGLNESDLGVATVEEVAENCRGARWGCVDCKKSLAAKLTALLDPIRERRSKWEQDKDGVMDILKAGTRRGNEEGNATVDRVKSAMHVDYWD